MKSIPDITPIFSSIQQYCLFMPPISSCA